MVNGYLTLDWSMLDIATGGVVVGAYDAIEGTRKPILISGMRNGTKEVPTVFVPFYVHNTNLVGEFLYNGGVYAITVKDNDNVTVATISVGSGGGGGGTALPIETLDVTGVVITNEDFETGTTTATVSTSLYQTMNTNYGTKMFMLTGITFDGDAVPPCIVSPIKEGSKFYMKLPYMLSGGYEAELDISSTGNATLTYIQ